MASLLQPLPDDDAPATWSSWRDDLAAATMFLTRLPLPVRLMPLGPVGARALRAFPVLGALIGLACGLVFWLASAIDLPPLAAALLALATAALMTGALHEDGLADCADGFGGGGDRGAKLAIMRDSRIGSYGTLALLFSLGLRAAALAAMLPGEALAALVAAHAASRAALPLVLRRLQPARNDGLAAALGRVSDSVLWQALGIGGAIGLLLLGPWAGVLSIAVALAAAFLAARLARRQVGGFTGDVLGMVQQAVEVAMLLTVAALW